MKKGKRILCNFCYINYPFATNKQVLSYLRPPYSIAYRPICIAPHRFYSTYIIPHFWRFFNTSGLISLICTIIHETFLTIRHTLFLIIIFVSFSYNFRFCLSTIYQSGARLSYKPPFHSLHRNSFLFRQNPADMLPLCRHLYRISLPSALRLYLPPGIRTPNYIFFLILYHLFYFV